MTAKKPHKPNGNKPGSEPYSKQPPEERKSPRGRVNPVVDTTGWRHAARVDTIKFDDIQKQIFLEQIISHGKRVLAAKAAGVCLQTVRNHMKWDPEFQELFDQAFQERADRVTSQLEKEALEGFEEPIYNGKTGALLGHKRVYETPIRLAILKRYDPDYKERTESTINGTVGVLVAPAKMSPQDWIAQEQARNAQRTEPDRDNLDAPAHLIEQEPRPRANDPKDE